MRSRGTNILSCLGTCPLWVSSQAVHEPDKCHSVTSEPHRPLKARSRETVLFAEFSGQHVKWLRDGALSHLLCWVIVSPSGFFPSLSTCLSSLVRMNSWVLAWISRVDIVVSSIDLLNSLIKNVWWAWCYNAVLWWTHTHTGTWARGFADWLDYTVQPILFSQISLEHPAKVRFTAI